MQMRIWSQQKEAYSNKKIFNLNPFLVRSVLDSNCKSLRDTAIRENFNLQPDQLMKNTHSKKRKTTQLF